jgi:hypothetical protein
MRRSILVPFLVLTALAPLGCTSNSGPTAPDADFFVGTNQTFALRLGDTVGIVGANAIYVVRFSSVLQDSRCPEGVNCVQAGALTIALSVQTSLSVQDITIDVPPSGGAEAEVAGELRIIVVEVAPPAREGVEIELLDYAVAINTTEITSEQSPS